MPFPRLLALLASLAFGSILHAQATLSLGSGSGTPGSDVTLSLNLGGSAQPAAAQFDLGFNPSTVSYQSSNVGPAASSKTITCSGSGGSFTCLIFGVNTDVMSNGVVATLTFRISSGTSASSAPIDLSDPLASTTTGTSLNVNGSDGTITINQPVNQAPTATNASVTTAEDIQGQPIVLAGTDPDGDPLSFSIFSQPSNGTLTGSGANRSYRPNPNYNGPDSFTFRVNDGRGGIDNGLISITVNPVNDRPTTMNQALSTPHNTPRQLTLIGNDIDGDTLTFNITNGPSNGTVSNGSGSGRLYTPNNGFSGPDSFTYQVSDGNLTANGTVSITVEAAQNEAPNATDVSVTTNEDTATQITLAANDPNGDTLSFNVLSQPSKGSLTSLGGNGANWRYTPQANANGPDGFTFRASDGNGGTDTASVTIAITAVNDPPTTMNQSLSTPHNTPKQLTLIGNDVDGDTVTFNITGGPSNGTVSNGSGSGRVYTPNNGFSGPDSFNYQASDGNLTANGTINITVEAVDNQAPTATDGSVTTNEDTPAQITLVGTDPNGDTLSFTLLSQPSKGSLTSLGGNGANWRYTPSPNENGQDGFNFRASDGNGGTDDGTFTINITPVNDPPTTQSQSLSTDFNTSKPITLVGSDVDGDTLTFIITTQPAHGTVNSGTGPNHTYIPADGYSGPDSFSYEVRDGTVAAAGTVTIMVGAGEPEPEPENDPPTATGGAESTDEDTPAEITLTGNDPNGDTLSFTLLSQPAKGSLTPLGGNGANWRYTPSPNANGQDSFNFRASDGNGGTDDGTFSINIVPVNDPPTTQDQSLSTDFNTSKQVSLVGSDVDGDTLTFIITTQPAHGTVNSGTGPNHTYVPADGYSGPDAFSYEVRDGTLAAAGTVTIMVGEGEPEPDNDPPTAIDDSVTTTEGTPEQITLRGTDPNGDPLKFAVMKKPSHGKLSGNAPNLTYTPNSDFHGDDSLVFQVDDSKGGTDEGTVSIRVMESESDSIRLTSLNCLGDSMAGGGLRVCYVSINERAPSGGVDIDLSAQSKQLSVPDSVEIRSRRTTGVFKVYSRSIEVEEVVQVTASLGSSTLTTELKLEPLQPEDLTCWPVEVKAGRSFTCRALLNTSSFSGDQSLSVESNSDDIRVPSRLRLRSGRPWATFRAWSKDSAKQQTANLSVGMNGAEASSKISIVSSGRPFIKVKGPHAIAPGKHLTIAVEAVDPNDLPVELSASDLPPVADFDPRSGLFRWTPSEGQAGSHTVTFNAVNTAEAASRKVVSIDVVDDTLKVVGFTNAARSAGGDPCSPGSLATLWGTGFTGGPSEHAVNFPLPTAMGNLRVSVNGREASLLFVGPSQVNLQCPSLPPGETLTVTVEKTDTGETATWTEEGVSMRNAAPAIYSLDGSGTGQGLVLTAETSMLAMLPTDEFDGQAAEPGDNITIYANGLGSVDHAIAPGQPAAASPLSRVLAPVSVKVGDVSIPVTFAGLAPGLAGVYQVNAVLSDTVPLGDEVPLVLEIQQPDGTVLQSNAVTLSIEESAPPPLTDVATPFE